MQFFEPTFSSIGSEIAPNVVVEINRATVRDVITPEMEAVAQKLSNKK